MATYLARDALRLPAASLLASSGLCANIEFEIWLLLGVNVATTFLSVVLISFSVMSGNSVSFGLCSVVQSSNIITFATVYYYCSV